MSDLSVLIPVLGRPHRVQQVLESLHAATDVDHDVLFICDPQDRTTQDAVAMTGTRMISPGGGYARKINVGVRATTSPLIFLGADDLDFHSGWFHRAATHMTDDIRVVGVNDLCSRRVRQGRHATHFLMARDYAEMPTIDGEPGPLSEAYDHSYVDDELVATARHRGAIAFATDAIVEHLHPDAGKAIWDETYAKGRARMRVDRRVFQERSRLWT